MAASGAVVPMTDKAWLDKREGETEEQYNVRLAHTCYTCGAYFVILEMLYLHEDECAGEGVEVGLWRFNE